MKNSIKNILNKNTTDWRNRRKYSNSNIDGIINQVGIELNNQKDLLVCNIKSRYFSRELKWYRNIQPIREIKNRIKI